MDEKKGQTNLRAYGHSIFDYGLFYPHPRHEEIGANAVQAGNPIDKDFNFYAQIPKTTALASKRRPGLNWS